MNLDDLLKGLRPPKAASGPRAKTDFWKPTGAGPFNLRLYRFGPNKDLVDRRSIHNIPGQKFPEPCTGDDCKICESYIAMRAQALTRERAYEMRQKQTYTFVAVPLWDPTKFIHWGVTEHGIKRVLPQIAKEGGWPTSLQPTVSDPPKPGEVEEMEKFATALRTGADLVCGPNGKDVSLVFEPKNSGFMLVTADVSRVAGQKLPFEESQAEDPAETRRRMDEIRKKRENGN